MTHDCFLLFPHMYIKGFFGVKGPIPTYPWYIKNKKYSNRINKKQ